MLKRLASLLLCFALAAGTALAGTPSGDAVPDASTGLRPDLGHRIVEQYAALRLVRGHYSHPDLNDALSSRILDRYIRQLDPNRLYLLASDVAGFEKYRDKLDDAIKAGNLDPAFSIYRVYRERLEQRIDYAL
ncbi:MAG: tail-specific protease, partial [Gammaproteobacteria bacterium]